jgi:hypothetical protein
VTGAFALCFVVWLVLLGMERMDHTLRETEARDYTDRGWALPPYEPWERENRRDRDRKD